MVHSFPQTIAAVFTLTIPVTEIMLSSYKIYIEFSDHVLSMCSQAVHR